MCLARALRASYGEDGDAAFETVAEEYAARSDGDDLQQSVVIALSCLPNGSADWIVSDLLRYIESDPQFYELAHAALALSFPAANGATDDHIIQGNLQRDVLIGILNNNAIWHLDMTFAQCLADRGLPTDRDSVAKLVTSTVQEG